MKRLLSHRPALLAVLALLGAAVAGWYFRPHSKPDPAEVLRADLVLRDGVLHYHGEAGNYSGLLVENYGPGRRKLAIEIRNGKPDGVSRGWFDNGQQEVEEHFVEGVSHGERTRWYRNGARHSLEQIDHGKVSGPYSEWYDNGQLAVKMTLRDGQPDGLAEAWHRSGALKSRSHLARGKILDRAFFNDTLAAR